MRLRDNARRLESLHARLYGTAKDDCVEPKIEVDRAGSKLHALSPVRVLERGYALVYGPDGACCAQAARCSRTNRSPRGCIKAVFGQRSSTKHRDSAAHSHAPAPRVCGNPLASYEYIQAWRVGCESCLGQMGFARSQERRRWMRRRFMRWVLRSRASSRRRQTGARRARHGYARERAMDRVDAHRRPARRRRGGRIRGRDYNAGDCVPREEAWLQRRRRHLRLAQSVAGQRHQGLWRRWIQAAGRGRARDRA